MWGSAGFSGDLLPHCSIARKIIPITTILRSSFNVSHVSSHSSKWTKNPILTYIQGSNPKTTSRRLGNLYYNTKMVSNLRMALTRRVTVAQFNSQTILYYPPSVVSPSSRRHRLLRPVDRKSIYNITLVYKLWCPIKCHLRAATTLKIDGWTSYSKGTLGKLLPEINVTPVA